MLPNPGRTKQTVWKTPPRQRVNGNHGNASKNSIIRSSIHAGAADRMVINIPISSLSWIFKQHCWEKGCLKIALHDRIWRRVLRNTASRAHIHTRKERFLIFFPSAKKWMVEGHNRLRDSLWPSCTMIFQKESPKTGRATICGSSLDSWLQRPHAGPTCHAHQWGCSCNDPTWRRRSEGEQHSRKGVSRRSGARPPLLPHLLVPLCCAAGTTHPGAPKIQVIFYTEPESCRLELQLGHILSLLAEVNRPPQTFSSSTAERMTKRLSRGC